MPNCLPTGITSHDNTSKRAWIAVVVKKFKLWPVALVLALACQGCALFGWGRKQKDVPEASLPSWLGRVVMVDEAHGFVLVDTGAPMTLQPGAAVLTFREKSRTGSLRVTKEARPPYVALEIVDGAPAIGDQAVLDESRSPKPVPTPAVAP
jgi:hypothetical protein